MSRSRPASLDESARRRLQFVEPALRPAERRRSAPASEPCEVSGAACAAASGAYCSDAALRVSEAPIRSASMPSHSGPPAAEERLAHRVGEVAQRRSRSSADVVHLAELTRVASAARSCARRGSPRGRPTLRRERQHSFASATMRSIRAAGPSMRAVERPQRVAPSARASPSCSAISFASSPSRARSSSARGSLNARSAELSAREQPSASSDVAPSPRAASARSSDGRPRRRYPQQRAAIDGVGSRRAPPRAV